MAWIPALPAGMTLGAVALGPNREWPALYVHGCGRNQIPVSLGRRGTAPARPRPRGALFFWKMSIREIRAMGIGIQELLVVLVIVLLLFGTKKLRNLGGDLGSAIKSFRNAMSEGEDDKPAAHAAAEKKDADKDAG